MVNSWIRAIKRWNKKYNKNVYCIPKKGTEEYMEVKAIQAGFKKFKKSKNTYREDTESSRAKRKRKS